MRCYVASSWRNDEQPFIVKFLRAQGFTVYDFKNPPDRTGFAWQQTQAGKPARPATLLRTLDDPIAQAGFRSDMSALSECDLCVLVMPAGISANLELGYACGAGKKTIVYVPDEAYGERPFEPELMWLMADRICTSFDDLVRAIRDLTENAA